MLPNPYIATMQSKPDIVGKLHRQIGTPAILYQAGFWPCYRSATRPLVKLDHFKLPWKRLGGLAMMTSKTIEAASGERSSDMVLFTGMEAKVKVLMPNLVTVRLL
jgi:hypothetical protein